MPRNLSAKCWKCNRTLRAVDGAVGMPVFWGIWEALFRLFLGHFSGRLHYRQKNSPRTAWKSPKKGLKKPPKYSLKKALKTSLKKWPENSLKKAPKHPKMV
uniref:Uncharacterized protein n=1 Tax=Micrurus corallinus TaxID=54390 RepID=A0A2D4GD46_MICCO